MTLNIDNLGKVWEALFGARAKAHNIGLMLEVPVGTLNSIREQYSNPSDQLREILQAWLEMAAQRKWATIVKELRSPTIGEAKLASEIEAEYCQGTPGQAMPRDTQIEALQQQVTELQQHLESKTQTIEQLKQKPQEQQHTIGELQSMSQSTVQPQPNPPQQEPTFMKLIWRDGPKAPQVMRRPESMATDGTIVYYNGEESVTVYRYHSDTQQWSLLPDLPKIYSTLVIAGRKLTSVGGVEASERATNSILSLTRGKWLPHFRPMNFKRYFAAAICHGRSLVIAGGEDGNDKLASVEVLNMDTRLWSIASSLPHPFNAAAITICSDRLYLLGGCDQTGRESNSVFTCSISDLLHSCQAQSTIWQRVADAPYRASSCATLCGWLVVVGGRDEAKKDTAAVSAYNESTNSWLPMEPMTVPRCNALIASLHDNTMMVFGGLKLDTVEIANSF